METYKFFSVENQVFELDSKQIKLIPYLYASSHFKEGKTPITNFGFQCLRTFCECGSWPIDVLDRYSEIVQYMNFDKSIRYLLIDNDTILLDSMLPALKRLHEHTKSTVNIYTLSAKHQMSLTELMELIESNKSFWSQIKIIHISQDFFGSIYDKKGYQYIDFELKLDLSEEEFVELVYPEIEYEDTFCDDCVDGYCYACKKNQNKCYCHRCKHCGECNDFECSCGDINEELIPGLDF